MTSQLETEIQKAAKDIEFKARQIEDFEQLCKAYEAYEQASTELERCQKELETLLERKDLSNNQLEKLQGQQKQAEFEKENLLREEKDLQESFRCYADYDKMPQFEKGAELEALSITDREARFKAITANLSQELKELEQQERKALKRFQEAEKELERLRLKYHLEPGAWIGKEYNAKEETYLEVKLEDLRKKIENKNMLWNEEKTQIAVLKNRMNDKRDQIRKECGKEEILSKAEIQDRDFEADKNQLVFQQGELQKKVNSLNEALQSYEENLTALAEYSNLPIDEETEWKENLAEMSREQLRKRKGTLVRDYKELIEKCRDAREGLVCVLNQIGGWRLLQRNFTGNR